MKPQILKALQESGIDALNDLQLNTIRSARTGRSLFLSAPTGSGKTIAYLMPVLEHADPEDPKTRGLIIAPTRELAMQISSTAQKLSAYTDLHIITLIGGMDQHHQDNQLKHRPTILIGTPGRLLDLLEQGQIHLQDVQTLVLDEADQILTTGQKDTVLKILQHASHAQRILVSATWNDALNLFLPDNYIKVHAGTANRINDRITSCYAVCTDKKKELLAILAHEPIRQAILFVHYKQDTDNLSEMLKARQILAAPFSSWYDEKTRMHTLDSFRKGKIRILAATDAAARGLDITDISHIIHYDLPDDPASFIHRSGRTAHQNNTGTTITLLTPDEEKQAEYITSISSPYHLPETRGSDLSIPLKKEPEKKPAVFTLWINAGKDDKLRPKDIIGALCTITDFKNLGALEIQDTSSTIGIHDADPGFVKKLNTLTIKGKRRKYKIFH